MHTWQVCLNAFYLQEHEKTFKDFLYYFDIWKWKTIFLKPRVVFKSRWTVVKRKYCKKSISPMRYECLFEEDEKSMVKIWCEFYIICVEAIEMGNKYCCCSENRLYALTRSVVKISRSLWWITDSYVDVECNLNFESVLLKRLWQHCSKIMFRKWTNTT